MRPPGLGRVLSPRSAPPESRSSEPAARRLRLEVSGTVQGVGFRPFAYRLANRLELAGFVLNNGDGVIIEAEGEGPRLADFVTALTEEAPPLARVETVTKRFIPALGERTFAVAASLCDGVDSPGAAIPPDAATCNDCLAELFDPGDRRYRYPFLNCTQCGPRFTIVRNSPYDRKNTTMADFQMCRRCRAEYEDPSDRRFHAEPICCADCGPSLSMSLEGAVAILREGGILAVKGLGGFHLACNARDEEAVSRLRSGKQREDRPFAVMAAIPEDLLDATPADLECLTARERPIVLGRRRMEAAVAPSVAPGTPWLGVMLPYTPLHHLLINDYGGPLVMTSANRSDEPIAFEDADASARLSGIADAFLTHDRPIHRRCEDSVVRVEFPIRRSRGHAPSRLTLPTTTVGPILATGAELKSTFCVVRGNEAFVSPHLGDLDSEPAYRAFRADVELYLEMLGVRPARIAHDLHPDYLSSRWAKDQGVPLIGVQHHHAHAASCLAEHGETGPALAVVFDGTGFGTDQTLWGGEVLRFDLTGFERLSHLEAVPLPGGAAAIREPWRTASSYLELADRPVPFERWPVVRESLRVNAPLSSGAGRLFDAVAALLGVRETVSYEGQAAIELEILAGDTVAEPYESVIEDGVIRSVDFVRAASDDLAAGRPREEIAAAFHEGLSAAAALACEIAAEPRTVVLSGGSFQNLRLLASTRRRLANLGFNVLCHRQVPPNDGGISFGQAAIAAGRL